MILVFEWKWVSRPNWRARIHDMKESEIPQNYSLSEVYWHLSSQSRVICWLSELDMKTFNAINNSNIEFFFLHNYIIGNLNIIKNRSFMLLMCSIQAQVRDRNMRINRVFSLKHSFWHGVVYVIDFGKVSRIDWNKMCGKRELFSSNETKKL